jgi:hypothetical protein
MKALNHLLAKALITSSTVLFPQTTLTGNGSDNVLMTDRSGGSRNGFMNDQFASAESNTPLKPSSQLVAETSAGEFHKPKFGTTQPRLSVLPQSSSDPAWLWLWVFALKLYWAAA